MITFLHTDEELMKKPRTSLLIKICHLGASIEYSPLRLFRVVIGPSRYFYVSRETVCPRSFQNSNFGPVLKLNALISDWAALRLIPFHDHWINRIQGWYVLSS